MFTACSHAGVVNVLTHARNCFPGAPLFGVMGGFHLAGGNERVIPETVDAMREFDLTTIAAAHCTGWRAVNALAAPCDLRRPTRGRFDCRTRCNEAVQ